MLWYLDELLKKDKRGIKLPGNKAHVIPGYLDPRPFIEDILGLGGYIYPSVIYDLEQVFSHTRKVDEVVKVDGVGSGKSMFASLSLTYILYLLAHMPSPQASMGLKPGSLIVLMVTSIREKQAKDIVFRYIWEHVKESEWFSRNFPMKNMPKNKQDRPAGLEYIFPHDITVECGSGAETKPAGYNMLAAVMDECDLFLERSLMGSFEDQAQNISSLLTRRIKSRFRDAGLGLMMMVSSARRFSSFVQKKYTEVEASPSGYATMRYTWAAKPIQKESWFLIDERDFSITKKTDSEDIKEFPFEHFKWDVGTNKNPYSSNKYLIPIPMPYFGEYKEDPGTFLRDYASIFVGGVRGFIQYPHLVKMNPERENMINPDGTLNPDFTPQKNVLYYGHVDLAKNQDALAFAFGHQEGQKTVIDFVYVVDPKCGQVVDITKPQYIVYDLRARGFKIGLITFDRYQSVESIQRLQSSGIKADNFSVETSNDPYILWREAHYRGEIDMPVIKGYMDNVRSLIFSSSGKIDHRVGGKDITDAVSGCAYHCRIKGITGSLKVCGRYDLYDHKS